MYFKKTCLLSLALCSLPLMSYADFSTYNYTNEDSSVKITSGTRHYCSMDYGIYTPKAQPNGEPGYSYADDGQINFLCITSENKTCKADIYNTSNCTGEVVGKAQLDLNTHKVTSIDNSPNPKYTFKISEGGSRLDVFYTPE